MKIETKYNIGDKIYYKEDGIIRTIPIMAISIECDKIIYMGYNRYDCFRLEESEIDNDRFFTSEEKLLASLSRQVSVKESPSKTFQRVNEMEIGSSYRR